MAGLRYRPENWWWRDGEIKPGPAVVFDVEGVLADAQHRQHLLDGWHRDWNAFFDACDRDGLIGEQAALADLLDPSLTIVLLTARPSRVQAKTEDWLRRHNVRWDLLIMRDYGDYSLARDFKHYTVYELRQFGFELRLALEDDPRNQVMFAREGIPCMYIPSGYH